MIEVVPFLGLLPYLRFLLMTLRLCNIHARAALFLKAALPSATLKIGSDQAMDVHAIWSYKERSYKEPGLRF